MHLAFKAARAKETAAHRRLWPKRIRLLLLPATILWLATVSCGLWLLWGYENTPGVAAAPPGNWPLASRLQRATDRATLVMLAHPHCPCTRASIGELAQLMAHTQGRVTAYVLFLKPAGFADDWEQTDLWQSAARIPGVTCLVDDDGAEARRFHAATSGQTLLYNPAGHLQFSGGITGSRGHAGDNVGRSAIVSFINAGTAARTETFVFGCPLFNPDEPVCRGLGHGSN